MTRAVALGLTFAVFLLPVAVGAQGNGSRGRIAFAAFVEDNWDIYSLGADGDDLRRHTFDPADDLAPSWSPDGRCLAFQSHRDGNWEIYSRCSDSAEASRLTQDLAFDGRPAWSPDGNHIAFDSFRATDLDVFVMDVHGGTMANLTESSSQGDFAAAWSPDGKWLAFTSVRYSDPDLFVMASEGGEARQLTDTVSREANPSWSARGTLAFVAHAPDERAEIFELAVDDPPADDGEVSQLTWWGGVENPAWSPDGEKLAAVWRRHDGEVLIVFDPLGGLPLRLTPVSMLTGPLAWTEEEQDWGEPANRGMLADPRWTGSPVGEKELFFLEDVEVGNAKLNTAVVPAFNQLRQVVLEKSGYDFLGTLSDMWRPAGFANDSSDYLSWHKAGRAIDLLWEYRTRSGMPLLEVAPELLADDTYWRLYLRCRQQDGSQGQPLTTRTWDLSYQARAIRAPETGGHFNSVIPYGYYIDLTELIRQTGWERISSIDQPDFHWHWNFLALEYWHLQRRGGLSWYRAMQEVYGSALLEDHFGPMTIASRGEEPWRVFAKGLPFPSDGRPWWTFVRQSAREQ
jgi:TolB protein